nr:hypothetical protein [Tanacetum cinerariifolium]
MSTPVFADLESSTQADEAQSSRVPVPLSEDLCEAIRQAYLVGTDTESEPFEDPESETPESPYIVAPPTCHVEESKGFGTSGARSTSSDSTVPLSPDHTLTYTTPVLVLILHRYAYIAVRILPMMSPGLSAGIAEVADMPDLTFCKRFRSSYDSSPSPTLPDRKRYRGTSELILGTDSEEIDESLDSDSESKDAEDEGPTAKDEDPTMGDEGLAVGIEDLGVDDESFGLDDENYDLDDESHGVDDESRGLDDEGRGIESDGLGLGEDEAVPEGQQQAAPVVRMIVRQGSDSAPEPGRSERVSAFRQPSLTIWTDLKDGMVYIDVPVYPPPVPPV